MKASSEDPDQTQHNAVSDLCVHCLPSSQKRLFDGLAMFLIQLDYALFPKQRYEAVIRDIVHIGKLPYIQ